MDKEAKTAFDNPWKTILENYFEDFLDFFFTDIHQAVDWTKPYTFLDKELEQAGQSHQIYLDINILSK